MRRDIGIKPCIVAERFRAHLLRYRHAIRLYFAIRMIRADSDQRAERTIEQHAFDFAARVRTEHVDGVVLRKQAGREMIETWSRRWRCYAERREFIDMRLDRRRVASCPTRDCEGVYIGGGGPRRSR